LINSNRAEVMIAAEGDYRAGERRSATSGEIYRFRQELVAPTLADSGIDKKPSARAQKLAAMSHWGDSNNTHGCRTA
jgi:hypothetical protein